MVNWLNSWSQLTKLLTAEIMLAQLVQYVAALLIIFGGIVPYIPQYLDIRRSKNADGFSTLVCFTLLIANTLRILFWFGHPFELPLLAQSVVMIFTMFVMVHLCTIVKARSEIITTKPRTFSESKYPAMADIDKEHKNGETRASYEVKHRSRFSDFDTQSFWKWTDFSSYVEFMCLFTGVVGALTYFLMDVRIYTETLGFLAVFFEALLGAPQIHRNFQKKSTQGMSIKMVLMWTSGDVFKTVYFLLRETPMQFWMCGSLQVALDVVILFQVWLYGRRKPAVQ